MHHWSHTNYLLGDYVMGVKTWVALGRSEGSFFFTILTPAVALGQPTTKMHAGDVGWVCTRCWSKYYQVVSFFNALFGGEEAKEVQ